MDTTNTTQHVQEQHNALDYVIPKEEELGFEITYQHYNYKKKTQELKIPIAMAKKYFPNCPSSTSAYVSTEGSSDQKHVVWREKLIFEDEHGQVWPVDYKYWKNTGYVLHGEDWNAYRGKVTIGAGDVLVFRKDKRQEKKYFVTIRKTPPPEQDVGRAANSIPRITTGKEVKSKPSTSARQGQPEQGQPEQYLGNAAGDNSIPSLPCYENNFHTEAFPSTNLERDPFVFSSAALAQDGYDNGENLDQDSGGYSHGPFGFPSAQTTEVHHGPAPNWISTPAASYGLQNTLVNQNEDFVAGNGFGLPQPPYGSFSLPPLSTRPVIDDRERVAVLRDKGKRPLENDEEEAPRNVRPRHGIGPPMLNFPFESSNGMIANWPAETRAQTNRFSLATTEVEEDQPFILVSKTDMKALEERIRKLEALVEGAKTREDALESRISILEAQKQASQNSSGLLLPELDQSQANVPPRSISWTLDDLDTFMEKTDKVATRNEWFDA